MTSPPAWFEALDEPLGQLYRSCEGAATSPGAPTDAVAMERTIARLQRQRRRTDAIAPERTGVEPGVAAVATSGSGARRHTGKTCPFGLR
jgi:hypothetical protein